MTDAISSLFGFINKLVDLLYSVTFELYGYEVSYFSIIFAFIVISMVVGIWWKGARG